METVELADSVEYLVIAVAPHWQYAPVRVLVQVWDATIGKVRWQVSRTTPNLSEAGCLSEGVLWAWLTSGLIGAASFMESQPERLMPEGP